MNALAGIRPQPFAETTFEAFKASDIGNCAPAWKTSPIGCDDALTLADAVAAAQMRCHHKDTLIIRETGRDGAVKLHLYRIRKSKPKFVHPAGEVVGRMVADLYAEPLCVIDGKVLS